MDIEKVFEVVRMIPAGKVTTYGSIALYLGLQSPRMVGKALHQNPDNDRTPCHRVVFADGSLAPAFAFGGHKAQREKLTSEGVEFVGNKVNLKKCLWSPGLV
jgi:methylated-DNA-protein-cysteine methyltransferase related protein